MTGLPLAKAAEIGFDPLQLQRAFALVEHWTQSGEVPGAALCVGRNGRMIEPLYFGRQSPDASAPLCSDALFLVASITKPVTVAAAMLLVERGQLVLEDKVAAYVPEFAQNGKEAVEIRHLMTHTSGLPDMLPNNDALRAAHQPLATFVAEVCKLPLLFEPGTKMRYQSMGTAMLGKVVEQIAGVALSEFLRSEIFQPLEMNDTSLGWQPEKKDRIAAVRINRAQQQTNWHWNTPYWLGFGAPWGGMITSPSDFARFSQMMLCGGHLGSVRVLSPASVRAMTTNQLAHLPQMDPADKVCRPWGLGWRLRWPAHSANFGDLLGPRSYGHWGATGTVCWMDPDADAYCILFTTEPQGDEGRYLARACNAVAAALV